MATFLTLVLICSSAGMVALLWAKHWELSTGRVIFGDARPRIGDFFYRILLTVEKGLPLLLRRWSERVCVAARVGVRDLLARVILALERALERTLRALRRSTSEPQGSGQASAFLREVAAYKKMLMRRRRKEIPVEF